MNIYPEILSGLIAKKYRWLVTGAAGFIGSHLTEALLSLGQEVTGLDDLSSGKLENIDSALKLSGRENNFTFIKGSITDINICREAVKGCDYVLNHAALVSVPDSMKKPDCYNKVNVTGFLNILQASREHKIKRVVYASSSAVYGDNEAMPKTEKDMGKFLSPYAMTKYINEIYGEFFSRVYNLECTGLRYFNVFGSRQNPEGAYAAVIPKWISAVKSGNVPVIFGDGNATRDFCSVQNVVKANILAALNENASGKVFNIGCGVETTLNELLSKIYSVFAPNKEVKALYEKPRAGDILRSCASIKFAEDVLKFKPVIFLEEGLKFCMNMIIRPRRLRKNQSIRDMVSETRLKPSMFIYPVFIREGKNIIEDIPAMPGQKRYSPDTLPVILERAAKNKIGGVLFFGIPEHKDEQASSAWNENGVIQQAIKVSKREFPDLTIIGDVCMCEYTSHGHCGIIKNGDVDNDSTLEVLARIAVSQANAGADIVAPSDMMDGHVRALREGLDANNFHDTLIFSYAVKYASGFYGPFREAAGSAPSFGDRKTYQMDPRNFREALKEAQLDIAEGADMIIIKPGLAYLDVLREVKRRVYVPVGSYSVSGEYSMIKAAVLQGWLNEKNIVSEVAISQARAGADIIISYYALDLAEWILNGEI